MKELKGTKTEQNLATAFAGESQAHAKYQYYSSKAKNDGYVQIANIFGHLMNLIIVTLKRLQVVL